jgi:hypothetical protein
MTIKQLVSKIAKHEGKKSQTSIGNIREIIKIIIDLNKDAEGGIADLINTESYKRYKAEMKRAKK